MARTREFNKDEVIERAMLLFAVQGYEATSIRDLKQVMGISSSSMYEVFGNKHGVYMASLARFCEIERARIAEMAQTAKTPQVFVERLFHSLEVYSDISDLSQASLAFNAMVEFGTRDHAVTELLLAHYFGITQIIRDVITRGKETGLVNASVDAATFSHTVLTTLQGVATLKGVKPDFAQVSAITSMMVSLLT